MSAPSEALNFQSVEIRLMQRLTNSIEPNIVRQMVTNAVKPMGGTYQAVMQVKVSSPVIFDIMKADVFHCAESCTKGSVMVSCHSLYRGLSPRHDMRWKLGELGRSLMLFKDRSMQEQASVGEDLQTALKKSDWLIVLGVWESQAHGEAVSGVVPNQGTVSLTYKGWNANGV